MIENENVSLENEKNGGEMLDLNPNVTASSPNKKQSFDYKYATQIIVTVIVAIVLALVLRAFCFPSILVCGSSMDDTLYGGVDVDDDGIEDGGDTVVLFKTTKFKQGDIIVFQRDAYTLTLTGDSEKNIIKRVIATEGQTVLLKNNEGYCDVYVDGVLLVEEYLPEKMLYKPILFQSETSFSWEVPDNCLFVMGDNRNVSGDSRYYGFVSLKDKEKITGKAVMIFNTSAKHLKFEFFENPF